MKVIHRNSWYIMDIMEFVFLMGLGIKSKTNSYTREKCSKTAVSKQSSASQKGLQLPANSQVFTVKPKMPGEVTCSFLSSFWLFSVLGCWRFHWNKEFRCQVSLETIVWKVPSSLCTGKFEETAFGVEFTPEAFPRGPQLLLRLPTASYWH